MNRKHNIHTIIASMQERTRTHEPWVLTDEQRVFVEHIIPCKGCHSKSKMEGEMCASCMKTGKAMEGEWVETLPKLWVGCPGYSSLYVRVCKAYPDLVVSRKQVAAAAFMRGLR